MRGRVIKQPCQRRAAIDRHAVIPGQPADNHAHVLQFLHVLDVAQIDLLLCDQGAVVLVVLVLLRLAKPWIMRLSTPTTVIELEYERGQLTGARAGRVLRGPGAKK